ncbi:alpha/beta fold hydrolase [Sphingobium sp. TCM1]|uniref:alpha/beta fold hydrolase n=1 Tax=Sphingobium sp. TCM1 TaxID=453246 RepID=UPI003FA7A7D2
MADPALLQTDTYTAIWPAIIGLIEHLDLNAPILVGHSMGGLTAAVVASHLGTAIKAEALVDPTFISPEWQREVYDSDVAAEHQRSRTGIDRISGGCKVSNQPQCLRGSHSAESRFAEASSRHPRSCSTTTRQPGHRFNRHCL